MSRSGYVDDCDGPELALYRANVGRALRGKRGQAFLREMLVALDAMPEKKLHESVLVQRDEDGSCRVCAMGAVAEARGLDTSDVDEFDREDVGQLFGITPMLAAEIAFANDEGGPQVKGETPEARWRRMRAWVIARITDYAGERCGAVPKWVVMAPCLLPPGHDGYHDTGEDKWMGEAAS